MSLLGSPGSVHSVQQLLCLSHCCPALCPCRVCVYGVEAEETLQKTFLQSRMVLRAGGILAREGSKEGLDFRHQAADRVEFGLDAHDGTLLVRGRVEGQGAVVGDEDDG